MAKASDSNGDRWRDGGKIKLALQRKAGTMKKERKERDRQQPIDCKSHEYKKRSPGTSSTSLQVDSKDTMVPQWYLPQIDRFIDI